MYLVECHRFRKGDTDWERIDLLSSKTTSLYNKALFVVSQHLETTGTYDTNQGVIYRQVELYHRLSCDKTYRCGENTKIMKQTLFQVERVVKSYVNALKEWKRYPNKFSGEPKKPTYKTSDSRNLVTIPKEALSFVKKKGHIKIAGTDIFIKTTRPKAQVKEVRIVPQRDHYNVEVVYEKPEQPIRDGDRVCGIDMGINNLMTLSTNDRSITPLIVNGRPLKAINEFYNKQLGVQLKRNPDHRKSVRYARVLQKRNDRIKDYLHKASKLVVDWLLENGIHRVIIGQNKGWKQRIAIGKTNNRKFCSIPHAKLIDILTYKCKLVGITVETVNESHTSKCSFIDNEPIGHQQTYMGKRTSRGMFVSKGGIKINADLNGSLNIIRRVVGSDVFEKDTSDSIVAMESCFAGYAVWPVLVTPHR